MSPQQINQPNLEIREFLAALYSSYFKDHEGYVELRFISKETGACFSKFYRLGDLSDLSLDEIKRLNATHHVYFGVNPRPLSQAKKQDDIQDVVCLWADVDGKDFDGEKDEALQRLQGFPIAPSIVIDSGHGYHSYWVFAETIINLRGDQRVLFKQTLSGMIRAIGGDKSKVHLDACLRLPGTLNLKDTPPIECKVVSFTDQTYRLEDFARFRDTAYVEPEAITGEMPAFGTRTAPISHRDENSAKEDVEKLEIPAREKDLIIKGGMLQEEGADPTRSARDFSIICSLIQRDYKYPTIRSIFFNPFLGCSNRIISKGEKALLYDVRSALKKVQPRHSEIAPPSPAIVAEEQLQVRCAADIEPEETSWLWPERFSLGKLSLIVGDPESGKSLFCAWMAAKVTSGEVWPDGAIQSPGKVIILQCEDDVAETVVPRLIQYGADLTKVQFVEGVRTTEGGDRMLSLLTDIKKLEDLICRERDVRLIIMDPMQAYLGAGLSNKVNPHADAHIRAILTPVKLLAEKYAVAVVGVVHLNKDAQKDMMYRVGGSIALVGLPRAIWLLQWDRDPNGFRYFQSMKSNRRAGVSGLAFKIDRDLGDVSFHDDVPIPTAIELLAPTTDRHPREEAKTFLMEQLKEGAREAREIQAAAEQNGINRATLFAAKKELGIKAEKITGLGQHGRWIWLPPEPREAKPELSITERIAGIRERAEREKAISHRPEEPSI